jgi:DNA-binding transcriptional ArsR family regulator
MRPAQEPDIFHAIAHPVRRTILALLRGGDRPAGALAHSFGVSFSAISQHLKILKDADLVCEHREGRQRIYQLRAKPLAEVWSWVEDFQLYWNERLDALEEHLDRIHTKKPTLRERRRHSPRGEKTSRGGAIE